MQRSEPCGEIEMSKRNQAAYDMPVAQGFRFPEDRGKRYLLEIEL
jgi:hypothetical protein